MQIGLKKSFQAVFLFTSFFLLTSCNPLLNFGVVLKGAFYRSGQPDSDDLKYVLKKAKVRTVLNLKGSTPSYEKDLARKFGARLIHMKMNASTPPTEEQLEAYLTLLKDPKTYPLWVHCHGGADRTGVMVAIYRMEFENWSKWRAMGEMLSYFHIPAVYTELTKYLYHYKRRYGAYEETAEEMKALARYLEK